MGTKSAIYDKCQRLAKQAAERELQGRSRPIKPFVSFGALIWVEAFNAYDKNLITEEEIKGYFHLGFVPEYSKPYEIACTKPLSIGPLRRRTPWHSKPT